MNQIHKYPRTPHMAGSKLQIGDEDLKQIDFSLLAGRELVVEEKMDGANSAISFDEDGRMLLQSRGHYLTGGPREKQFDLLKGWANTVRDQLWELMGSRYVVYGEWCYGKHTIFYNALPHYFLEFDILDLEKGQFLSTARRQAFLKDSPIVSVPVLAQRSFSSYDELVELVGQSTAIKGRHIEELRNWTSENGQLVEQVVHETDPTPLMEGLYLKIEDEEQVIDRLKWVRAGFLQAVDASGSHWMNRPILPNWLAPGIKLF